MIEAKNQSWSEFSTPIVDALAQTAHALQSRSSLIPEVTHQDEFDAEIRRLYRLLAQIESHLAVLEKAGPAKLNLSGEAEIIIMQPASR